MLLDLVYVGVVILLDLVFQQEGGLQAFVPQDEEVELELEDVAIGVLQVDEPLSVLAFVVLFDARLAYDASLVLFNKSSSWWHIEASFRGIGILIFNCIVFKIFLMCGLRSTQ